MDGRAYARTSAGLTAQGREPMPRAARVEQFVAVADLAILGVLDLQPGRGTAITLIRAVRPLPDNTLQVIRANGVE
jgi:hypothetical protein